MTRPKSMTPNRSRSRTGATIANSTIDCDRWLAIRSASTLPTSVAADRHVGVGHDVDRVAEQAGQKSRDKAQAQHKDDVDVRALVAVVVGRSEEHTSELQSRGHLVCRLLLEKKKKILCNHSYITPLVYPQSTTQSSI